MLYAFIQGKPNYVQGGTLRADNLVLPQYTTKQDEAMQFDSEAEALQYSQRINNPHHREFKTTTIQVDSTIYAALKKHAAKTVDELADKVDNYHRLDSRKYGGRLGVYL